MRSKLPHLVKPLYNLSRLHSPPGCGAKKEGRSLTCYETQRSCQPTRPLEPFLSKHSGHHIGYAGKLEDAEAFDACIDGDALQFVIGNGRIIPASGW